MVVVNSAMIMTYYEIGTIINKRKTWGSKYISNLANDLKEYGKSFSFRNLKYMSQFAKEFSVKEIGQHPVAQISQGTLITVIIPKSKSPEEILWYINKNQAKVIIKFINTYIDTFLNILSSFLIQSLFYYKPKKYY